MGWFSDWWEKEIMDDMLGFDPEPEYVPPAPPEPEPIITETPESVVTREAQDVRKRRRGRSSTIMSSAGRSADLEPSEFYTGTLLGG